MWSEPCYAIEVDGEATNIPAEWGNILTSSNAIWDAITCNFEANGYRLPAEVEWKYAARIRRGGSWDYDASSCVISSRSNYEPHTRAESYGFRVVRSIR